MSETEEEYKTRVEFRIIKVVIKEKTCYNCSYMVYDGGEPCCDYREVGSEEVCINQIEPPIDIMQFDTIKLPVCNKWEKQKYERM